MTATKNPEKNRVLVVGATGGATLTSLATGNQRWAKIQAEAPMDRPAPIIPIFCRENFSPIVSPDWRVSIQKHGSRDRSPQF